MPETNKHAGDSAREKILAVAGRLFWERGFNGTSVRDIAEAYGCKPANLYNFFPGKEALVHAVLVDEMRRLLTPLLPLADEEDGDPVDQLARFIRAHLSVTLDATRSTRILFDVALENLSPEHRKDILKLRGDYDRVLRTILERGRARGLFRIANTKFAGFMIASMITRSRLWFDPNGPATPKDLADFILHFTVNGIG